MKGEYTTVKLPKGLVDAMDRFIKEHPEYTSRTDLVKEAVRLRLKQINNIE